MHQGFGVAWARRFLDSSSNTLASVNAWTALEKRPSRTSLFASGPGHGSGRSGHAHLGLDLVKLGKQGVHEIVGKLEGRSMSL